MANKSASEPTASISVTTALPNANLAIDVYDLSQDSGGDWTGPLVTRQGHLVRNPGSSTIPLTLWGADWKLHAGDRIAVRVTDNNQDWWLMAPPSGQQVTVRSGSIKLPFLSYRRNNTIQGAPGAYPALRSAVRAGMKVPWLVVITVVSALVLGAFGTMLAIVALLG